jgi:hypothetical protein
MNDGDAIHNGQAITARRFAGRASGSASLRLSAGRNRILQKS